MIDVWRGEILCEQIGKWHVHVGQGGDGRLVEEMKQAGGEETGWVMAEEASWERKDEEVCGEGYKGNGKGLVIGKYNR